MSLSYVPTIRFDESFTLSWVGTTPDTLNSSTRAIYYKMTDPITGVNEICKPVFDIEGDSSKYKIFYRIKNNVDDIWHNEEPIDSWTGGTTPGIGCMEVDPCYDFEIEIRIYFNLDKTTTASDVVYVNSITMEGERNLTVEDEIAVIDSTTTEVILQPKEIYKVYRLDDFFIKYRGTLETVTIQYRFTQDNGRHWTDWEYLTTENISTLRLDELRFAEVQYYIKANSTPSNTLTIYDIILIGDFENVSANYLKTNRYGLKEDCLTDYLNNTNLYGASSRLYDYLSCYLNGTTTVDELKAQQDKSEYWNPYEFDKITAWGSKLAGDTADILGWTVDYYLSEPDKYGEDIILNEYQLKNIVDKQLLKIVIPENKFPSESMIVDQFDLNFINNQFEVHIVKEHFKEAFGITKRPAIDDIVYICVINELFYVKHAQAYRDIMNSALYYKVILEKYSTRPDIQFALQEAQEAIEELTDNTTIDEIFGEEQQDEKEKIANKVQMKPKSFELTRDQINSKVIIDQIKLFNGNNDFAGGYYDFKDVVGRVAIDYKQVDQELEEGNNRSFVVWFNFNNKYDEDRAITKTVINSYNVTPTAYSLLDNYDSSGNTGYKLWVERNKAAFLLNQDLFTINNTFLTNVWYALVVVMNQRQRLITISLYKRNSVINVTMFNPTSYQKEDVNITNTTGISYYESMGYERINNTEDLELQDDFEILVTKTYQMIPRNFEHSQLMKIIGSNIKYTNLRIFNEIIPSGEIKNILDQYIIKNEEALILSDNAHKKIFTINFPNKNWL